MGNKVFYRYYVEGENEKNLLEVLKTDLRCIKAGKVEVLNIVKEKFTIMRIRMLKPNTIVVFVYDTDVNEIEIFKENIKFLKKQSCIKDIVCIPQVNNLEDELMRSCRIKSVKDITNSSTKKTFKSDFNKCTNLGNRLNDCQFDIGLMWQKIPENSFKEFKNQSDEIKIIKPDLSHRKK